MGEGAGAFKRIESKRSPLWRSGARRARLEQLAEHNQGALVRLAQLEEWRACPGQFGRFRHLNVEGIARRIAASWRPEKGDATNALAREQMDEAFAEGHAQINHFETVLHALDAVIKRVEQATDDAKRPGARKPQQRRAAELLFQLEREVRKNFADPQLHQSLAAAVLLLHPDTARRPLRRAHALADRVKAVDPKLGLVMSSRLKLLELRLGAKEEVLNDLLAYLETRREDHRLVQRLSASTDRRREEDLYQRTPGPITYR